MSCGWTVSCTSAFSSSRCFSSDHPVAMTIRPPQGKDRILVKCKNFAPAAQASQIDLCADLDHLLHRHSVAPVFMNRVAVEIGKDRFGHSLNAAVLRNNRFVTDVVSRVLKLERDLPCVSKILQHREQQWVLHVAERDGELIEASTKNFDLEPRVLCHHWQCLFFDGEQDDCFMQCTTALDVMH